MINRVVVSGVVSEKPIKRTIKNKKATGLIVSTKNNNSSNTFNIITHDDISKFSVGDRVIVDGTLLTKPVWDGNDAYYIHTIASNNIYVVKSELDEFDKELFSTKRDAGSEES